MNEHWAIGPSTRFIGNLIVRNDISRVELFVFDIHLASIEQVYIVRGHWSRHAVASVPFINQLLVVCVSSSLADTNQIAILRWCPFSLYCN